jgi:hypothetical protein
MLLSLLASASTISGCGVFNNDDCIDNVDDVDDFDDIDDAFEDFFGDDCD